MQISLLQKHRRAKPSKSFQLNPSLSWHLITIFQFANLLVQKFHNFDLSVSQRKSSNYLERSLKLTKTCPRKCSSTFSRKKSSLNIDLYSILLLDVRFLFVSGYISDCFEGMKPGLSYFLWLSWLSFTEMLTTSDEEFLFELEVAGNPQYLA